MDLREVSVPALPLERLTPLIGATRAGELREAAERSRELLTGRTVWNVNSTASGGGVAEMLQVLVGYIRGAGIDIRWLVVAGDPAFFELTKRVHNQVHGVPGDGGPLGRPETARYRQVLDANLPPLLERVRAGDVVLLHDPQTAGLAEPLSRAGARVVWRCHIGLDHENEWTRAAWAFLRPHLQWCDLLVFSRRAYAPSWVPADRVAIVPPSIDPFSPKNQDLAPATVRSMLHRLGLVSEEAGGGGSSAPTFTRRDGTTGEVVRGAEVIAEGPLDPGAPLVVQVSRWDRLKDMGGVMEGFAKGLERMGDAHLALVGPSTAGVLDDPEGAAVLDACVVAWQRLPADRRARIHLVSLPMDDVDENAAMVNALQRRATVVVQKSLAEGFGLTVAEAMWKAKPVVASAVGGIVDQVAPGTGILLDDPRDRAAFADALAGLLQRPEEAEEMGRSARAYVTEHFVGDRHLLRYGAIIRRLAEG